MSNLYPIFCLASITSAILVVGILIGYTIKNSYRYRLLLHQNRGEAAVRKAIVTNFKPPNYFLLNNVTVPIQNGTTQIDHILISTKGVFVIETKNYSGWIFANARSKQWTQVIYRIKNKFQNPLHQNYKHIKAMQEILEFLPKDQIYSVVVFSGNAVFKSSVPANVVYLRQLVDYIGNFKDDVISENRVEFCVGRLECRRYEVTKATDIQHRAYLANKFNDAL